MLEKLLSGRFCGSWKDEKEAVDFLKTVYKNGVGPLLYQRWHASGEWQNFPEAVREELRVDYDYFVVSGLTRQKAALEILSHLSAVNVPCLFMKGLPLGFLLYANPALRPASDIDIFIQKKDEMKVKRVLETLGYGLPPGVEGKFVSNEFVAVKETDEIEVALDFHFKISNVFFFSNLLSFEEIWARSVPVPPLGSRARSLDPVHSLFLACTHLASHHNNERRLIWLYDIHLLIESMDEKQHKEFLELVSEKKVAKLCANIILKASEALGTGLPQPFSGALRVFLTLEEPSAEYLSERSSWKDFKLNWSSIPNVAGRLQYLSELTFPSPDYMMKKYSSGHKALLPFLYLRRSISGMKKWLFN